MELKMKDKIIVAILLVLAVVTFIGGRIHDSRTGFETEKQLNAHVLECNEQDFFQKLEDFIDIKALVDIYVKVNDFLAKIPHEDIIGFILDAINGLLTM